MGRGRAREVTRLQWQRAKLAPTVQPASCGRACACGPRAGECALFHVVQSLAGRASSLSAELAKEATLPVLALLCVGAFCPYEKHVPDAGTPVPQPVEPHQLIRRHPVLQTYGGKRIKHAHHKRDRHCAVAVATVGIGRGRRFGACLGGRVLAHLWGGGWHCHLDNYSRIGQLAIRFLNYAPFR